MHGVLSSTVSLERMIAELGMFWNGKSGLNQDALLHIGTIYSAKDCNESLNIWLRDTIGSEHSSFGSSLFSVLDRKIIIKGTGNRQESQRNRATKEQRSSFSASYPLFAAHVCPFNYKSY